MNQLSLQIGLTPESNCSYLPNETERLGVVIEPQWLSPEGYDLLIASGYRRSSRAIYKPMCAACSACTPLRIDCQGFTPSRSQKRQQAQMRKLRFEFKTELDENWFTLYEKYIRIRHSTGSMFPANKEQFFEFVTAPWMATAFLHVYEGDKLIAIAVTDVFPDALSAVYSFFEPEHSLSLGTLCVLFQIEFCRQSNRQWLYPGFQIDACKAMNYKTRFSPHQKLIDGIWQ
ncbi:arginyltransferase [Photobacterium angustum]|uniref:Aspartate/glutamate leucyltransferase n=1 Tax=Photobacterium angustum TaxID=661 RepID=A0A2S7VXG1_PHOAN|nr:arginyltransferase [Photobacterium angustum]PQJ66463.1 arginyltransferase [Photobacterium angustum]